MADAIFVNHFCDTILETRNTLFDRPFDRLTVLSRVEGLTVLSRVEGLTVLSKVEGLTVLSRVEGLTTLSEVEGQPATF